MEDGVWWGFKLNKFTVVLLRWRAVWGWVGSAAALESGQGLGRECGIGHLLPRTTRRCATRPRALRGLGAQTVLTLFRVIRGRRERGLTDPALTTQPLPLC